MVKEHELKWNQRMKWKIEKLILSLTEGKDTIDLYKVSLILWSGIGKCMQESEDVTNYEKSLQFMIESMDWCQVDQGLSNYFRLQNLFVIFFSWKPWLREVRGTKSQLTCSIPSLESLEKWLWMPAALRQAWLAECFQCCFFFTLRWSLSDSFFPLVLWNSFKPSNNWIIEPSSNNSHSYECIWK